MKRMEPQPWEKQLASPPFRQGEGGFSKELMRKVKERVQMREHTTNRTWLRISPLLALCAMLMFGFAQREQLGVWFGQLSKPVAPVALELMDKEKDITLKVGYFHEDTFMMRYGKAFTIRYPNVGVKVVPMGDNGWNAANNKEKVLDLMEKEQLDVLFLPPDLYGELAKEGRLYPLDSVMKQDNYDLQNIYGGVTDSLRKLGDGKLYGLSPEYEMNALYYNKDLFDKYGVPYPKSGMSWEDVLQLAARFPTDERGGERVYGLSAPGYPDASQLAAQIAKTKGLSLFNAEGNQVTLDTDGWKKVWSIATEGYAKGYIFRPQPWPKRSMMMDEVYKRNPFISGTAAMAVTGYSLSRDLDLAESQYKMSAFNWDIASEPIEPARPGESASFTLGAIYAVNAKSEQQRAAWEMVKLINSAEIAKKLSRTMASGSLPTRLKSVKPDDGRNYEPFYTMRPSTVEVAPSVHPRTLRKFYDAYGPAAAQKADAVVSGRLRPDEAVKQLQEEAQKALNAAMLSSTN
jgi:multiple sugar transport system substrate-binding protein